MVQEQVAHPGGLGRVTGEPEDPVPPVELVQEDPPARGESGIDRCRGRRSRPRIGPGIAYHVRRLWLVTY